ncbi:CAMK family protein kinase [Tritrichomonas foetus]|uniref:non-specific serine/threonine protein kinase n=1 Tax=Tritrichomonas foetus TaxID=1144522 RepID=A0A1J4JM56_9EUKA|nr:CAMK family protein kinase [Tritrichomonas foetus]|eukprot:OHT00183.1 CAMK family protein kinase [Tritrichomonas foetus]
MDRYTKVKDIGKGSYGQVSLMQDTKDSNKYVVVKTIKIKKRNLDELRSAQQEANFLKELHHPNVIQYYDSFKNSPTEFCIVLEYADAKDVNHYVQRHPTIPEDRVLQIFSQVILGISYLHSQNILHRDIKIANIFLFKNGLVKIGDFGISREISDDALATTMIGTPYFMAPEILHGLPYGKPADIWAAGCVLFELMTGDHAFTGITRDELFENIKYGETPKLPQRYSDSLKKLLLKMLEKDPALRPTAKDIIQIPLIQKTLITLEKKIKIDPNYSEKSPKKSHKKHSNSQIEQSDDETPQEEDIPDWIKDNKKVASELVRQSFSKIKADLDLFHQIIRSSISHIPKIVAQPEFSSNLSTRRTKLENTCKERFGEENYQKIMAFVKENWTENRDKITLLIGWEYYPEDEMKLIDSIMMIDRFLTH